MRDTDYLTVCLAHLLHYLSHLLSHLTAYTGVNLIDYLSNAWSGINHKSDDNIAEYHAVKSEFMDWLGENGVPFSIAFTKADKLGPVRARQNAEKYMKTLLDVWEELPPYFITSSEKKQGRDEVLDYIEEILNSPSNT